MRHRLGRSRRAGAEGWGALRDLFQEPAPRADRGTVRHLVLDVLAGEPRHGYEILRVIDERSGGVYRPSPGVVYPTLQMLEDMGFVRMAARDDRKVYAITEEGRKELSAHAEEVREFYESASDQSLEAMGDDLHDLAHRLRRLLHLCRRSFRRGRLGPAQVRRVRAVLDRAIGELEELFGEEA